MRPELSESLDILVADGATLFERWGSKHGFLIEILPA
jgi:hypothetical protein